MSKCENYRSISLLSNISKIFERVMYSRLDNFLTTEIIYTLPISTVEQICKALDRKMFTCGAFIDFKEFDTVNLNL